VERNENMPKPDELTAIRNACDLAGEWIEEEAWRRAGEWTITPALLMHMEALIALEATEAKDLGHNT
jgi:hypothetical protein